MDTTQGDDPMKVHELHAQLADLIADNRGDDDVYLTLYDGPDEKGPAGDSWQYDWALTTVDPAPHDEAFVTLTGEIEKEATR